ncbi:hypothetical protein [Cryptosporangium phraense]|uniref:Uncharacterized protein n=1 Tax=Cryptosporangium phraense TaxID=2593070 RepID=A0A545AZU6_9ACTN|nr:hypothetical protein [Cryptosporangium phraense]TQS46847.1 hypothetical protein FL583_00790 [Cryptosporangium phraense]
MDEPGNNTAWQDRFGDTWVRSDEAARKRSEALGTLADFRWWALCEGPAWEDGMRGTVGVASPWSSVEMHGPLEPGDSGLVQRVLDALNREL